MILDPAAFAFPADLLLLVEHDVWARVHDERSATVGITAFGIKLSGEIYMCRPRPVGARIEQGRAVAVVELAKAIVSVKSAVSGEVAAINPLLETQPELVHLDPYGAGWIARIELHDLAADRLRLVSGEAALDAMRAHAQSLGGAP
jgi:glycine cleavage system H protein